MKRKLLCTSASIATRQRVYSVAEGLEVDEIDHYEVRRWRVLYDDVILVTYHRYRGALFLAITGIVAAFFGTIAILTGRAEPIAGWWLAGFLVTPFLALFLVRLIVGIDEVNVYSHRSQARLRFGFRKGRARQVFDDITAAVRRSQAGMA